MPALLGGICEFNVCFMFHFDEKNSIYKHKRARRKFINILVASFEFLREIFFRFFLFFIKQNFTMLDSAHRSDDGLMVDDVRVLIDKFQKHISCQKKLSAHRNFQLKL